MVDPETWKSIGAIAGKAWSLVGPLAGVLVGAWLARSWDRRKWVNDNRKGEYRELVTELTTAAMALVSKYQVGPDFMSDADLQATADSYLEALRIIQDRIFIAHELEKMSVFDRWGESVKILTKNKDVRKFEDTFEDMKKEIVAEATKY